MNNKKAQGMIVPLVLLLIIIGVVAFIFLPDISSQTSTLFKQFDANCAETGLSIDQYQVDLRTAINQGNQEQIDLLSAEIDSCFPGIKNRLKDYFKPHEIKKIKDSLEQQKG